VYFSFRGVGAFLFARQTPSGLFDAALGLALLAGDALRACPPSERTDP
jgi:hypothetical protein